MNQGQIKINTPFGKYLYDLCVKHENIKTVVEIGTWYGMGSTECLIEGLKDSKREGISFVSLETNNQMYNVAVESWKGKLPEWAKLLHGSIVDVVEMDADNLGFQHQDESNWFDEDKNALLSCSNILSELPEIIDLLFLDGGEFTTKAEFWKLKDRARIVVLDDTTMRKCKDIRSYVIDHPLEYVVILDDPSHRGGVMVFEKIVK